MRKVKEELLNSDGRTYTYECEDVGTVVVTLSCGESGKGGSFVIEASSGNRYRVRYDDRHIYMWTCINDETVDLPYSQNNGNSDVSSKKKVKGKCAICKKDASNELQGSYFCDKDYIDAVAWLANNKYKQG
jgi:hypothetical protein